MPTIENAIRNRFCILQSSLVRRLGLMNLMFIFALMMLSGCGSKPSDRAQILMDDYLTVVERLVFSYDGLTKTDLMKASADANAKFQVLTRNWPPGYAAEALTEFQLVNRVLSAAAVGCNSHPIYLDGSIVNFITAVSSENHPEIFLEISGVLNALNITKSISVKSPYSDSDGRWYFFQEPDDNTQNLGFRRDKREVVNCITFLLLGISEHFEKGKKLLQKR